MYLYLNFFGNRSFQVFSDAHFGSFEPRNFIQDHFTLASEVCAGKAPTDTMYWEDEFMLKWCRNPNYDIRARRNNGCQYI
jgi:hypothetical protein